MNGRGRGPQSAVGGPWSAVDIEAMRQRVGEAVVRSRRSAVRGKEREDGFRSSDAGTPGLGRL